jgi:nucleotide-binding universal stress UspA family protein
MIKTMLVHVSGTESDAAILSQAAAFAGSQGAHLDCLHVRPGKGDLLNIAASSAIGFGVEVNVGEILVQLEKDEDSRTRKARAAFEHACKSLGLATSSAPPAKGPSAAFREMTGDEADIMIDALRANDLALVAGGGAKGGMREGNLARLLVSGGRPLILCPGVPRAGVPKTIAVAWKPSSEAARAVSAAIPLLAKAEKVVLLTASEGDYDARENAGQEVVTHLNWHGVSAEVREVLPAGRSASEAILDVVRDIRADLLVMGAYGRARFSEILFGGFTQRILPGSDIPVLLFH